MWNESALCVHVLKTYCFIWGEKGKERERREVDAEGETVPSNSRMLKSKNTHRDYIHFILISDIARPRRQRNFDRATPNRFSMEKKAKPINKKFPFTLPTISIKIEDEQRRQKHMNTKFRELSKSNSLDRSMKHRKHSNMWQKLHLSIET